MTERQELGSLEAMLFAHASRWRLPPGRRPAAGHRARTSRTFAEIAEALTTSGKAVWSFCVLNRSRWQMTTRPYYGEMVERILDDSAATRRFLPPRWKYWLSSPTNLQVAGLRSFIEQVRGVDCPPSQSCWTKG